MKTKFKVEFLTPDGNRVSETKTFEVNTSALSIIDEQHAVKEAQRQVNAYAADNNYEEWRFDV
jgi:hypothetical protein